MLHTSLDQKKNWIWASLFAGQLQNGVRTPPKICTKKRVNYDLRILRQSSVNHDLLGKANNKTNTDGGSTAPQNFC